ncbi:MAG: phosphoribosyltransferase family protein [Chloroflexota bacterium]
MSQLAEVTNARFNTPTAAGHELALDLRRFLHGQKPFVLAIPPDGVPVAASIARELNAPLDLAVSRRLVTEGRASETLGAVTPDRTLVVNKPLISLLGLSDDDVEEISIPEWAEAQRVMQRYRRGRPYPSLQGHTAIVVDDGLTTGYTMLGAVVSVRKMEPSRIVVAVPVSSLEGMELVRDYVDDLLALTISTGENFSVEQYYTHYSTLKDQEVIWTLDDFWREPSAGGYTETF